MTGKVEVKNSVAVSAIDKGLTIFIILSSPMGQLLTSDPAYCDIPMPLKVAFFLNEVHNQYPCQSEEE